MFLFILDYQEKLGNDKEPCLNHDSCQVGLHCGKNNCLKIVNYWKMSFDCCEECKRLRYKSYNTIQMNNISFIMIYRDLFLKNYFTKI